MSDRTKPVSAYTGIITLLLLTCCGISAAAEVGRLFGCEGSSSPERVVKEFREKGFVSNKPYSELDGIQSYAAQPGHTLFGLPFVALFAWEEDSKFFVRGPGTSPGTHFSFVVRANQRELEEAARSNGIQLSSRYGGFPEAEARGFSTRQLNELPSRTDKGRAYARLICRPKV